MSENTRSLKSRMAVPPIPQAPPRSHGHRGHGNRIRMEISQEQCAGFIGLLARELKGMSVESVEFKSLYGVYWALKAQMDKRKVGEQ